MLSNKKKGDIGELLAIQFLQKNGYKIIQTNFKFSNFGEIDIISLKDGITCFIEVKYRTNLKFGTGEESITKTKLRRFKKTIEFYVLKNNLSFEKIRFDVISILKKEKSFLLKHYKNLEI